MPACFTDKPSYSRVSRIEFLAKPIFKTLRGAGEHPTFDIASSVSVHVRDGGARTAVAVSIACIHFAAGVTDAKPPLFYRTRTVPRIYAVACTRGLFMNTRLFGMTKYLRGDAVDYMAQRSPYYHLGLRSKTMRNN